METSKQKIIYWDTTKLIPAEYNPRFMTEKQAEDLEASVKRFGMPQPIVVNVNPERYGIIVGGHMRWRVAQNLGISKVPVVEMNLTLDQEKELNVRFNKNSGSWDHSELANHFDIEDLSEWGWSNEELKGVFGELENASLENENTKEQAFKVCPNCGHEF